MVCGETVTAWLLVPGLRRRRTRWPEVRVWIDQFVARRQAALTVVLRARSPRTAGQPAGAGMGVTIAPVSAPAGQPSVMVRSLEPRVRRDVLAITIVPPDALAGTFRRSHSAAASRVRW